MKVGPQWEVLAYLMYSLEGDLETLVSSLSFPSQGVKGVAFVLPWRAVWSQLRATRPTKPLPSLLKLRVMELIFLDRLIYPQVSYDNRKLTNSLTRVPTLLTRCLFKEQTSQWCEAGLAFPGLLE